MNRRFKQYKNLAEALRRSKIANSGTVASMLLETFIYNKGIITARNITGKGLCEEGQFKKWRNTLSEYIIHDFEKGNFSKYLPTEKLEKYLSKEIAYINKGNMSSEILATKKDIESHDDEIAVLWKEIEQLKESLDGVINIIDPPADEEKREALRKGHYHKTLLRLVKSGEF